MLIICVTFLSACGQDENLLRDADPQQLALESWPQWRGENRNGIVSGVTFDPEALNRKDPVLWQTEVGQGYSAPSIQGGRLYILGKEGKKNIFRVLDAFSGEEIWSYSYDSGRGEYPGPRCTPLIDGDMVFILSRDGLLVCLNTQDGREIWTRNLNSELGAEIPRWGIAGSPVIEGDILLLNAAESGIALNKNTGEEIWVSPSGICGYSTPVLFTFNNQRYAAIFGQNKLYTVHLTNGQVIWEIPWSTEYDVNAVDPLIFDNKILLSSGYNTGCALFDFSSGKPVELWRNKNLTSHFPSFVYKDGYIYGMNGKASSSRGEVRCVDAQTGEVVWGQQTGFGSLIMVNDKLIITSDSGKVYVADADPAGYNEYSSAEIMGRLVWTPPVIYHGLLYLRNSRGNLVCVNMRPK
jgi:outer membrane protein assembly factor BamB